MENLIVFSTLAFALVFVVLWWRNPKLREWIERPKYRFQESVRSYDQERRDRS